jgi:hypothetical protein
MQIRYSLAKEYEDLGEYAKSFAHLQQGAVKRRANLNYDVTADVATVDWIIEAFPGGPAATPTAAGAAQRNTSISARPYLSRPRPAARSPIHRRSTAQRHHAGGPHSEQPFKSEVGRGAERLRAGAGRGRQARQQQAQLPRRELVARSAHIDFAALGREYLERASAAVGACEYFTDKMPLNYLYCGLIRRALPNAKIIHLTRHPMASGYAMYKTLFKDGYPFSYDLAGNRSVLCGVPPFDGPLDRDHAGSHPHLEL